LKKVAHDFTKEGIHDNLLRMEDKIEDAAHNLEEKALEVVHMDKKLDIGLFYKSQFHHMHSLSQEKLDVIKQKHLE